MKLNKSLKKLKGDASARIFFRNTKEKSSSIIVYANKDKRSNLLIYDSINKILLKNNILAPKLLSENYSKNYIEIKDFGNRTIFKLLRNSRINKLVILKKIIRLLVKLQLIQQREVKDFKKKNYKIPYYYPKILLEEAKLFSEWYIDQYLVKSQRLIFKKKFNRIVKNSLLLTIPHPRMHLRKFVLLPLFEIYPHWSHPLFKKNIKYFLDKVKYQRLKKIKID